MRRVWPRIRATWRVLWRSDHLEAAMQEEMRFHVEMEAERLMREHGLDPQEAYRQAHVRFGGLEKYKEEGRDARGRRWLDAIALDARLGVRMLVKHRGLTLVGGFAMAVAIAVGATSFEVITEMLDPALPLEDGERVVARFSRRPSPGSPERRVLHDFVVWREQLTTVRAAGCISHGSTQSRVGERAARAGQSCGDHGLGIRRRAHAPLLGRYLLPGDEREGAPPVVVIGL